MAVETGFQQIDSYGETEEVSASRAQTCACLKSALQTLLEAVFDVASSCGVVPLGFPICSSLCFLSRRVFADARGKC
jgi:hypothetical protein